MTDCDGSADYAAVLMARPVTGESWLHEPRFARELAALQYAQNQTRAIPALAQVAPEDAVLLFRAMLRGWERAVCLVQRRRPGVSAASGSAADSGGEDRVPEGVGCSRGEGGAAMSELDDWLDAWVEASLRELFGEEWHEQGEAMVARILADLDKPPQDGCC